MCKLKLAAAWVATWLLLPSALFAIDNESHYGDPEYGRGLAIRWVPCSYGRSAAFHARRTAICDNFTVNQY
jgi:hypothetical protein